MKSHKDMQLKFKEFDYDGLKLQLPEDYEPIPYLPTKSTIKRNANICIHGLSSEAEAVRFVTQYMPYFPQNNFNIQKGFKNAIEYEYTVIAPQEISVLLERHKTLYSTPIVKCTQYNNIAIPPVLYRTIGRANVETLFERGELLLSTFRRCRILENDARRDKYELRNIVEIHEQGKKIEVDVGFDDSLLLLCTSLPPIDTAIDCSDIVKITDVPGFCKEITKTLVEMGLVVAEVLYGPCVYNDKVIAIETDSFVSAFINKMYDTNTFNSAELFDYIYDRVENDIIMNKPSAFRNENEYRFVWKLVNSFDEEKLLIKNPNLSRFCERLD